MNAWTCVKGLLNCFHFFLFFFSFCSGSVISTTLLNLADLFLSISLFIPSTVFFISVIVFLICLIVLYIF